MGTPGPEREQETPSPELTGVIMECWDETSAYIRTVADLMGLRDCRIRLNPLPIDPDSGNAGGCQPTYGRRSARISLLDAYEDAEELRNTVVHELLHVHLEPIQWHVNGLEPILGQPAFQVFDDAVKDQLEVAVDSITECWAETLPLPVIGVLKAKEEKEAA